MNKIIAVYDKNNIITRILDIDLLDSIKNDTYKIFENSSSVSIGENVNSYDDEGYKYSNSKLFELDLLELKKDEILDGEEIREKTEIEKFRENPTNEKIIETDDTSSGAPAGVAGNEYIREKTMLEKYNDNIITKDEYNEYQKEQRANKYQYTTDLMYQALSVRKLREDITDDDYVLETQKIEAMILEIKAEFPYME